METIKFYIYTKNWYYPMKGNEKIYLLKTITDRTSKDIVDIIIKIYKNAVKRGDINIPLNRKKLLQGLTYDEIQKPKTFPKFTNETPFKVNHNKIHIRPKIMAISWDGETWGYQFENIGHKTDFIKEKKLEKI